jgi:hypothetical protein
MKPAFGILAVTAGFGIWGNGSINTQAGTISPTFGPVEIVRGEEVILVKLEMPLRVGDIVRIGNKAEAELDFPKKFVATAKTRTQLRIIDKDGVFIDEGSIHGKAFRGGEVTTKRGFIKSSPGAEVEVTVSPTGETQITNYQNQVRVFDWGNGEVLLNTGEELRLSTDTDLSKKNMEFPENLRLSITQLKAIEAKLVIARTKVITGVEKDSRHLYGPAGRDFASAEKTFRSIAQVLNSARNLEIATRKNLNLIKNEDIFAMLSQKLETNHSLLIETKAVESLLSIINNQNQRFGIVPGKTGVEAFDRVVLLDHVFALGTEAEESYSSILKQKYAVTFLQQIQNETLRIDQITKINEAIAQLPRDHRAQDFLTRVQNLLSPDLAEILAEKVENIF